MRTSLVTRAFEIAYKKRKPKKGLIFHSDQGTQYSGKEFQKLLQSRQVILSMSSKGRCYDNAAAEAFFVSFKVECIYPIGVETE